MRIDKYLKVSRIMKRRAVSRELAKNDRVEINGRIVKPAHEVQVDDLVTVTFGSRKLTVRILSLAEKRHKQEAQAMYEVIKEEFADDCSPT